MVAAVIAKGLSKVATKTAAKSAGKVAAKTGKGFPTKTAMAAGAATAIGTSGNKATNNANVSPTNTAVGGVSKSTRAAGSLGGRGSAKGSGVVASPAKISSKPSSIGNASIESLLKIAINHLASIDETLKNQLDFDRSQVMQEAQANREAQFEASPQQAAIESKETASPMQENGILAELGKTAGLAALLSLPVIADDIKSKFQDIKDKVLSKEGIIAGVTALAAGAAGAVYNKFADKRNAKVDAAPHTKETVAGEKGKASVLTDAEKKNLEKQKLRYNEQTGRYHEVKPDGKTGKMVSNEKAAEALNKTKPQTKLPKAKIPGVGIVGGLLSVGIEASDYISGEKEATKENLAESAGGLGGGAAGAMAGAAAGAAVGSFIPVVGTAIGGLIGGTIGYMGGDILGRKAARAVIGSDGETAPTSPPGSVSAKKPKNKVSPQEIADYLKSKGVSDIHATGMIVNIAEESGFDSAAVGDNGRSGGLFQHYAERFDAMRKVAGEEDWDKNWKKQIDYALSEPDTKKYMSQNFATPGEAAAWFLKYWERPAAQHVAKRMQNIDKQSEGMMNDLFGRGGQMVAQGGGGAPTAPSATTMPGADSKAAAITPPSAPASQASTPAGASIETAQAFSPMMPMGGAGHQNQSSKGMVPSPGMADTGQDWALYFNVS